MLGSENLAGQISLESMQMWELLCDPSQSSQTPWVSHKISLRLNFI